MTRNMSMVPFLFLLAMSVATANPNLHEGEIRVQMSLSEVGRVKVAVKSFAKLYESNIEKCSIYGKSYTTMGLRDCAKLYNESESRLEQLLQNERHVTTDDALTWLTGVLTNHRTCFDGLGGDFETNGVGQNLTSLLSQALAFYANEGYRDIRRGEPSIPPPTYGGAKLTTWTPTSKADFVVAKDGSGTHRTINDAVAALGRMSKSRGQRVIVHVKSGVYNEKVKITKHMVNVMFVGDGIDKTVITGNRNVPDGSTTLSSATFGVSGDGFWARDITFENTAGPGKHQAVALLVSSDHSIFYRCSFKAYQDTLYVHSLRQFYRDCQIYGTIDFIFGNAQVVFQNCDIFVRRPMNNQANIITAQGRETPYENSAISIQGSRVRPSQELLPVKNLFKSYLGRPWRKYSRTVFMQTDLDGLIDPKGWREWRGTFALSTLFYGEYMNTGAGAVTDKRVNWPGFHVLHNPQDASPFMVSRLIQGELWIPASGVPFQTAI